MVREGQTLHNRTVQDIHVHIDKKDINFIRVVFTIDVQQDSNILKYLDIWRYAIKHGIAVKGMTNK